MYLVDFLISSAIIWVTFHPFPRPSPVVVVAGCHAIGSWRQVSLKDEYKASEWTLSVYAASLIKLSPPPGRVYEQALITSHIPAAASGRSVPSWTPQPRPP